MSSEGPACRRPLPSPESLTWLETFTLPGPGQQQRQHLGQPGSMPTLPHLIWAWMSAAMKKTPTPPQHRSARARPPSPAERSPARGLKGARKTGLSHAQLSAPLMLSTALSSKGICSRTASSCTRSVSRVEVVASMLLMAASRCVLRLARLLETEVCSTHVGSAGSPLQLQLHSPPTSAAIVASLVEAVLPSEVASLMFEVSMSKTPDS
mmetsp:Transcript_9138/g.22702  ORF Transcript_9138/g.22702 Transcript_9138/m.22702 type:complete len:209 (+) Transcript_9138:296-922(+)